MMNAMPNQFHYKEFSSCQYLALRTLRTSGKRIQKARLAVLAFVASLVLGGGFVSAADALRIVPATKIPSETIAPQPAGDQKGVAAPVSRSYAEAYRSIPFSRAEYQANPSYRHDSAMELLFGQMRPTTIVRYAPQPVANEYDYITPYYYNLHGHGHSYNFYYPRPSVYRHY